MRGCDPAGAQEWQPMALDVLGCAETAQKEGDGEQGECFERFCAASDRAGPAPRVLVVAAHPDDEVIGAGVRLGCLGRVWCLHLTDGAPRDGMDARAAGFDDIGAYARARRRELLRALRLVGIRAAQAWVLGVADQTASFELMRVTRGVLGMLRWVRPEVVLTHPYEGGHPDHDAAAFAVQLACELVRGDVGAGRVAERELAGIGLARGGPVWGEPVGGKPAGRGSIGGGPLIVEFTSYHAGAEGLVTGRFRGGGEVRMVELSAGERELKRRMVDCFVTQRRVLEQFSVDTESFRVAPRYDFTVPPHPGRLWYEHFDWGTTGADWRRRAAAALEVLSSRGAHRCERS